MSTPATPSQEALFAEARALGLSHTQMWERERAEKILLRQALKDIREELKYDVTNSAFAIEYADAALLITEGVK